jgi:N-acetylglucosamine kinase-like BadF-type ATPase
MILIADSGSTKTDWRIISDIGEEKEIHTTGINPQYLNTNQIYSIISAGILPQLHDEVPSEIYYYGAGCSSADRNGVVEEALHRAFPASDLHVDHDLLAAARALCGNEPGIACILGTGSNSCQYDGEKIIDNIPSLGFLMGDEGSGAYLGKLLIRAYLYRELPYTLVQSLKNKYNLSKDVVLDSVYNAEMPGTYLATFARFLNENRAHPVIHDLIFRNFELFFRRHLSKYEGFNTLPISFVGSIAFHFSDVLREVAAKFNTRIGKILQSPCEGLVSYHQQTAAPLKANPAPGNQNAAVSTEAEI